MGHILRRRPEAFNRYVEPFAGSASLFWALRPEAAVLSDLNEDLISCYEQVRDRPTEVYDEYAGLENEEPVYYQIRSQIVEETCPLRKAAFFLYLNRFCFNGLYRTNRQGRFNVPYGGKRTGSLPSLDVLKKYSEALSGVTLCKDDFEVVLTREVAKGDFVYLDPPFFTTSTRVFKEYTHKPFSKDDLDRLHRVLELINDREAMFIASYMDERDSEWSSHWSKHEIQVLRRMSGFRAGRRLAQEVLISNFEGC